MLILVSTWHACKLLQPNETRLFAFQVAPNLYVVLKTLKTAPWSLYVIMTINLVLYISTKLNIHWFS